MCKTWWMLTSSLFNEKWILRRTWISSYTASRPLLSREPPASDQKLCQQPVSSGHFSHLSDLLKKHRNKTFRIGHGQLDENYNHSITKQKQMRPWGPILCQDAGHLSTFVLVYTQKAFIKLMTKGTEFWHMLSSCVMQSCAKTRPDRREQLKGLTLFVHCHVIINNCNQI